MKTILIKLIAVPVTFFWGTICLGMMLIGTAAVKLSEVRIFKFLALIVFIGLASCEKESQSEPTGCWECQVKQDNGIELIMKYCNCTEQEIILIANEQAVNGTKVTCKMQ